jgi:hypothetical protein
MSGPFRSEDAALVAQVSAARSELAQVERERWLAVDRLDKARGRLALMVASPMRPAHLNDRPPPPWSTRHFVWGVVGGALLGTLLSLASLLGAVLR